MWQSACVILRKWWSVLHANQRGQWKTGIQGRNKSASDDKSELACGHHTCHNITALMNIRLSLWEAHRKTELGLFNILHLVGFSVFPEGLVVVITRSLSHVIIPPCAAISRMRSAWIQVSFRDKLHFWLQASVQHSFVYMKIYCWS